MQIEEILERSKIVEQLNIIATGLVDKFKCSKLKGT